MFDITKIFHNKEWVNIIGTADLFWHKLGFWEIGVQESKVYLYLVNSHVILITKANPNIKTLSYIYTIVLTAIFPREYPAISY